MSVELNAVREVKPALPWYKYRMVWLMLGLPLIVVFASFITLFLAIKSDDGVVTDDYYKQGLAINQDLNRDTKAKSLGLKAQLQITGNEFELKLAGDKPINAGQPIQLTMQNMGVKSQDLIATLIPVGSGVWKGKTAQALTPGYWQVHLSTEEWRLIQTVKGDFKVPIAFEAK